MKQFYTDKFTVCKQISFINERLEIVLDNEKIKNNMTLEKSKNAISTLGYGECLLEALKSLEKFDRGTRGQIENFLKKNISIHSEIKETIESEYCRMCEYISVLHYESAIIMAILNKHVK